ncbi:MAG: NAD(P)H-dependent glycerol-3-phosphate dehydrogenase [Candidatus Omnitrophota bacterium]
MNEVTETKISFLGDGGWGTTLAVHLAKKNFSVKLWGAFNDNVQAMQREHENKKYLPGIELPDNLTITGDLPAAVTETNIIVLSTPSQYLEGLLKQVKSLLTGTNRNVIFLSVVKGIEKKHLSRMSELVEKYLGKVAFAVLSGPTIAIEVAQGIPSSAVIASKNKTVAAKLQKIFNSATFRVYTNTDVIGVELGGSLKNVIAIACGVCDGLGFGANTKSALLTRGLAEMSRLGEAMGAKPRTFSGLSGLGDLVTTCFSPKSRNRTVGEKLGKGDNIETILENMVTVAEGIETSKAVQKLARRYQIDMPIATEVFRIIYKGKDPLKAMTDLMTRSLKSE